MNWLVNRNGKIEYTPLIILGFLLLMGCASKQVAVDLKNASPHEITASNITKFQYKETFYLDRVIDNRKDSGGNKIGTGQTGVLNKETPMLLDRSFEATVHDLLSQRMKSRGFQLTDRRAMAEYKIQVKIKTLQFSEKTTFISEHGICDADLSFLIGNKHGTKGLTITANSRVEIPGIDVTDNAPKVLATCLDMIVIKIIDTDLWSQLIR